MRACIAASHALRCFEWPEVNRFEFQAKYGSVQRRRLAIYMYIACTSLRYSTGIYTYLLGPAARRRSNVRKPAFVTAGLVAAVHACGALPLLTLQVLV